MPPQTKEKWNKELLAEVMSSEESGPEEDDMFVKPLPWHGALTSLASFYFSLLLFFFWGGEGGMLDI